MIAIACDKFWGVGGKGKKLGYTCHNYKDLRQNIHTYIEAERLRQRGRGREIRERERREKAARETKC